MDVTFESLEELYKRIKPALTAKKEQMHREGYVYVKEEDIWNYLKEIKWINSRNLSLYQMTCDILDADNIVVDEYLRKKLNLKNRKLYFDEF